MSQQMLKLSQFSLSTLIAITFLSVSGCGGGGAAPDTRPERVPFGGVAKLNGATVEDALITFHPVGTGNGSSGKTDAQGNFSMSTFGANDGVVPGDYQVTLTRAAVSTPQDTITDQDDAYNGAPTEEQVTASNTLPPKFENPKTSGVTVTVTESNTDFVLEFK